MTAQNQFALLGQRRFAPYFVTQFLGAFNDNVFKNALLLLLAFHAADRFSASSDVLINLSAGLFVLPFFLFSALAGQLADKYPKASLIRYTKILEIVIMLCAAAALWYDQIIVLIALLFLMGMQSSLFGPVKFGILPQLTEERELLGANGLVETGTFLAILLGTAVGGILIGIDETGRFWVALAVVLTAVSGYFSSVAVPEVPALAPQMVINWNPVTATWRLLAYATETRILRVSIIGISWFWFLGSVYLAQLPNYTRNYLGGDEQVVTLLLSMFSIGVGTGSLLCERIARQRIDAAIVPLGAAGLTLFGMDLALSEPYANSILLGAVDWLKVPGAWRVLADVLLLGVAGGVYIVPLYTLVQHRAESEHRSRVVAANNVLNALFMVAAAGLAILVLNSGYTIPWLFGLIAVLNTGLTIMLFVLEPEFVQDLRRRFRKS